MLTNLKALIVVLTAATAVFVIAKPTCMRFMSSDDFTRRRNVWFTLTVIAFVSPNFWLFALAAMVILGWAGRKDTNPVALYAFVLSIIPTTISLQVPIVGINSLFQLGWFRILSIAVLVPAALRFMPGPADRRDQPVVLRPMDILIICYVIVQVVLMMPYESMTASMRRIFLLTIDILVLYFVVSRACTSRRAIVETMACYTVVCAVGALLAVFETGKGWLLYQGLGFAWDSPVPFAYGVRDGLLRAQVWGGNPIPFGYTLAIAFGFWLYLSRQAKPGWLLRLGVPFTLWAGMLATYSRAPWVVGAAIPLAYAALAPRRAVPIIKPLLLTGLLAGAVLFSPVGERVIAALPFIGTANQDTIAYREQLAADSWRLIMQHPFLGNPAVLQQMENLRQGQGVIDLVNTYVEIGLFFGLAGVAPFLAFFIAGIGKVWWGAKKLIPRDLELSLLGVDVMACMLGTLLMLATHSFGWGLEKTFYLLAGLAAGYERLCRSSALREPRSRGRKSNEVITQVRSSAPV